MFKEVITLRGQVYSFDSKKGCGWIYAGPGQLIFAHKNDVWADAVGRRYLRPNCEVQFEMGTGARGGLRALRIRDISAATAAIDPETYQEVGLAHQWNEKYRYGFATRPDGDTIFVSCYDLITLGEEDLPNGQTYIRYKIGSRVIRGNQPGWYAKEIEILEAGFVPAEPAYVPEVGSIEEVFLNAPDPQSAPASEPSAFTPEEMKLPLKEIIRRRKAA
jgi:cold shock CspA family protein